jgi:hypothetical protein
MNDLALLSQQLGVSDRTLRRAFNEGAIHGERLSPRRLRLPASEKVYLLDRWPLLGQLRAVLRTQPNVTFALLFGSVARGDDGPGSDLDLLVETRDPSLSRLVDFGSKVEAATGRRVDLLRLGEVDPHHPLLAEALQEGRVLVDREDRWPELRAQIEKAQGGAKARDRRRKQDALAAIDRLLTES